MIGKLFLLGLCAVAFAQESSIDTKSDLETLKKLTEDGKNRVLKTVQVIDEAPYVFRNLTLERIHCLEWEITAQGKATNQTVAEAIFKGLLKNKKFTNFQCISKAAQETLDKLDSIESQIGVMSGNIVEKGLKPVRAFERIMNGFYGYCEELNKQKSQELNKASNQEGRKKILMEVAEKMKLLSAILKEVDDFVEASKFKFLEEHVNFAHQLENNIRKVQREGAQKILKCVN